jgi:hypothetical protein
MLREQSPTRLEPWESGLAVRRDWPDGGHEFIRLTLDLLDAARFVVRDQKVWGRGPVRPLRWSIVAISVRDFDLHRRRPRCQAPDCPTLPGGLEIDAYQVA